jgi:multiple sugar transport system permease protein
MNGSTMRLWRSRLARVGLYSLVLLIVVWTLGPFLWLFLTSISTQAKLNAIPIQWIPTEPTFEHYQAMFDPSSSTGALFLAAMRNSLIIASTTTVLCLVFGVLAAYSLARFNFPGRNLLIMGMLSTRLLPTIALVVPFYVIIVGYVDPVFRMFDTRHNLIILYTSFIIGLVVWIMRGYFATIPKDLEEQAKVDGASRMQALLQIILPLSWPGLVTTGLLAFLLAWDEFLLALIFSRTSEAFTMPYFVFIVGSSQYYQSPAAVAAGGFMAALPPVILALMFQNRLVSGLTSGAVKG